MINPNSAALLPLPSFTKRSAPERRETTTTERLFEAIRAKVFVPELLMRLRRSSTVVAAERSISADRLPFVIVKPAESMPLPPLNRLSAVVAVTLGSKSSPANDAPILDLAIPRSVAVEPPFTSSTVTSLPVFKNAKPVRVAFSEAVRKPVSLIALIASPMVLASEMSTNIRCPRPSRISMLPEVIPRPLLRTDRGVSSSKCGSRSVRPWISAEKAAKARTPLMEVGRVMWGAISVSGSRSSPR